MTNHSTETVFFDFFCPLRAKRRAQGCAAHFEASIRPILRSVAAHQGPFASIQSLRPHLKNDISNHGNCVFWFLFLSDSQTEGTVLREPSICQILTSVAAHQGRFRALKSLPGFQNRSLGAPKSVPGDPKSLLGGSKIGSWGILGGSWRASRELQGLRKAPRAFQGAPGGSFLPILDAFWSDFGVILG